MSYAIKSVILTLFIALLAACGSTPITTSDGQPALERTQVSAPSIPDGEDNDSSITVQGGFWYSFSYPRLFGDTFQARYNDALYMNNRTASLNNTWCTLYNFDMPWWWYGITFKLHCGKSITRFAPYTNLR